VRAGKFPDARAHQRHGSYCFTISTLENVVQNKSIIIYNNVSMNKLPKLDLLVILNEKTRKEFGK